MPVTPRHPHDGSSPASATRGSLAHSNRAVFERADVVAEYSDDHALRPAERVILDRYRADYDGKDVMDLGVGAGRTAVWQAPHAIQYVGVDYSPRMVKVCRQRFPRWRFECKDARDLAAFGTASFDFVFFSYNGIDYVDHEDRKFLPRWHAFSGQVARSRSVVITSRSMLRWDGAGLRCSGGGRRLNSCRLLGG